MFFIAGFLIVLIDQVIKTIITLNMPYTATIGSWIKITNIANTGMAYSLRKK